MEDRIDTFHTDQTINPMAASLFSIISIQSARVFPIIIYKTKKMMWTDPEASKQKLT